MRIPEQAELQEVLEEEPEGAATAETPQVRPR